MFALFLFMQGLRLSSAPEVTIWLHQLRRAHYQVEANPGTYQVMMYCVIKTPVKSSWHDSVEVFLLKGGINEAGWRRNGTMEGLQWAANKGGVTCECEDAIT